nr:MAG TPA: hypothetical protein [Caudoviricetes sp.]
MKESDLSGYLFGVFQIKGQASRQNSRQQLCFLLRRYYFR